MKSPATCEKIGDAIVKLAVFQILDELEIDEKRYRCWSDFLVRNENLASFFTDEEPYYKHLKVWADKFEVNLGEIYYLKGFEAALSQARNDLKKTKWWKKICQVLAAGDEPEKHSR